MLDLQYEKCEGFSNFLALKNPPTLLEYSRSLNEPLSQTTKKYNQGLSLLNAVVEAFSLFEKYDGLNICLKCGNVLAKNKECEHKEDVFSLYDESLDKLDYLGFMSFERFSILHAFDKTLLSLLISHGRSKNKF